MKERPILFSAAMVRAILEGRKSQTRRIVKPQPTHRIHRLAINEWCDGDGITPGRCFPCPYGIHGDRLYARETWAAPHAYDHLPPRLIPRDARIHYAATEDRGGMLWRPSIHMPRWASRITLEITGVRVERLQEISEEDAEEEGAGFEYCEILSCSGSYKGGYANLWERINGAGSWDANPWVWVIEFKRVEDRP